MGPQLWQTIGKSQEGRNKEYPCIKERTELGKKKKSSLEERETLRESEDLSLARLLLGKENRPSYH